MKIQLTRLSRIALWRIALAGLCLGGAIGMVAQNFSDWSSPVSLGPTINTASAEQ